MKIRSDIFTIGDAKVAVGVYYEKYLPPSMAFDYQYKTFTIIPPSQKIEACPTSLVASHKEAGVGSVVTYKAYIQNTKSKPWNFTIGMSIGKFDAEQGIRYNTPQGSLPNYPPCNIMCYKDNLGDFVFVVIPPNYTEKVERKFEIPEYFEDQDIDVAVGVWKEATYDPNTGHLYGKGPICFVYFKNVTKVSGIPSLEVASGRILRNMMNGLVNVVSMSLGIPTPAGMFITWVMLVGIVDFIFVLLFRRWSVVVGTIILIIGLWAGVIAGYVPWYVSFIITIIALYLGAKMLAEMMGG